MTGRPARLGRLLKRSEFLAAAKGRRFHTERMTVQGRSRAETEEPGPGLRIGFTVTRKVGHATERNRIRRRLRQAAGFALPPDAPLPLDLVVVGRRDALAAPFADLVGDLQRALHVLTRSRPAASGRPRPSPSAMHSP